MKKITTAALVLLQFFALSQKDSCEKLAVKFKVRILIIDKMQAIATSNSQDDYQLVLLEILEPKMLISNNRIVVRNMFNIDLKEGRKCKLLLQKLNWHCWPSFQSELLIENKEEIYRVLSQEK